jgi:RecA-family ATPase
MTYDFRDYTAHEFEREFGANVGLTVASPVGLLWRDFKGRQFTEAERILFGLRRGNVGLLLAETHIGKTTLALNLSLTLATDRTFPPFIEKARGGLRVMYVDGESTRAELQEDVARMVRDFSQAERARLDNNLLIVCDEEVDGELLNLANARHMRAVTEAAQSFKPDLTVVDTMAALFDLEEENSNTEVKRDVMQPLKMLAREANGALLLAHHIGKPRGEEGSTGTHAYKGRGASNFGCLARSVVTMAAPNRSDAERVIVALPKAKGYRMKDVVLRLDPQTRWFKVADETPPETSNCLREVVALVKGEMKTREIVEAFKGRYSKRAVEDALTEAVKRPFLKKLRQGLYAPLDSADSTPSYSECGNVELDGKAA